MSSSKIPLTAIVLTYNEAVSIETCLQSMARIDEVIVVDSLSTDDTLESARQVRPDARFFTNPFKDFGDQRNWALDNAAPAHEWILFVDADEYCTPELLDEIAGFIQKPRNEVGAFVAGKNYFLGKWLKRSTMYPSYQLRLLKFGQVRYRKEGHGQKEVTQGPLGYLVNGWIHDGFHKGLHQWIERHNQYSTDEIDLILELRNQRVTWADLFHPDAIRRRRALKQLAARAPARPIARFLYVYVWKLGFLDGYPGLVFCMLRFAHDVHIGAKLEEQKYLQRKASTTEHGNQALDSSRSLRRVPVELPGRDTD